MSAQQKNPFLNTKFDVIADEEFTNVLLGDFKQGSRFAQMQIDNNLKVTFNIYDANGTSLDQFIESTTPIKEDGVLDNLVFKVNSSQYKTFFTGTLNLEHESQGSFISDSDKYSKTSCAVKFVKVD